MSNNRSSIILHIKLLNCICCRNNIPAHIISNYTMVILLANRKNMSIRKYSFYSLLDMEAYNSTINTKQNGDKDL